MSLHRIRFAAGAATALGRRCCLRGARPGKGTPSPGTRTAPAREPSRCLARRDSARLRRAVPAPTGRTGRRSAVQAVPALVSRRPYAVARPCGSRVPVWRPPPGGLAGGPLPTRHPGHRRPLAEPSVGGQRRRIASQVSQAEVSERMISSPSARPPSTSMRFTEPLPSSTGTRTAVWPSGAIRKSPTVLPGWP